MRPIKSSKRVNVKSQIHRAIRGCVEQLERRQLMAIGLDPVANAGGPYTVAEGSAVIISGANSFDPDGTVLGYKWDLNYNSEVGFRTSVTGNPIQYSASDGPLTRTIALRVTDIDGNTNTTTTTVTVNNVAPTITLAGVESIADRSPYTLNFSATDPGADTISNWLIDWGDSTAATSVAGSVTSANHTYIGASGRIITVTATDDDGAHQAFKEITVNAVVPVVTVVAAPTAQEGVAYSISFSSTGVGGDTRDGWVVDWGDGTIVFKDAPITGDSHTYADNAARIIEVTALSVAGDPTVATVSVNVQNVAPTVAIDGLPEGPVNEGSQISVSANVFDVAADTLIYGWSVWKSGVRYTLPESVNTIGTTLAWTPRDNGDYKIRLTVIDDDEGSTTYNSPTITVENVAPTSTMSSIPSNVAEGDTVAMTVAPSDVGADDTFTYAWSVTRNEAAYTLAVGTVTTGSAFNFIPRDNGSYIVTCVISDDDLSTVTKTSAPIVVANVNPTATVSGEPVAAIGELVPITLTVTAADAGAEDTRTYLWSVQRMVGAVFTPMSLDEGIVRTGTTFTFTPPNNGTYKATVVVTDNDEGQVSKDSQSIVVNNSAPIGSITEYPPTANEGDAVSATAAATDATEDVLTYTWSVKKNTVAFPLPQGTTVNTRDFTFTPTDNGSYVLSCVVTDGFNATTFNTDPIIVANVAPTGTITGAPLVSVNEGAPITLTANPADAGSADTFTYLWSVTRNDVAYTLTPGSNTAAQLTFTPNDEGSYVATVVIKDDDLATVPVVSSAITVVNVNPTVSISGAPGSSIAEGSTVTLTTTAADVGSADQLSYAWSVKRNELAYTLAEGTITTGSGFSFIPRDNGSYVATVIVTDGDTGQSTANSAPISVTNVNPTGTITGVSETPITEGTQVTLTAHPLDAGADDTFTYAWSVKKSGFAFVLPDGVATNAVTFTFTPTDNGSYIATCVVRDNDLASVDVVSNAIVVTNVAPTGTISGAPAEPVNEGAAVTLTANPADVGSADTFTYVWSVTRNEVAYTLTAGSFTAAQLTFTPNDEGTYVATVTITDDDLASVPVVSSAITVVNVNPTVSISGEPEGSIAEGSTVTLTTTAADAGSDQLSYAWSVKRNEVTYVLAQGTITNASGFSFIPRDNGSYIATVIVTDGDTGQATANSAPISVTNVNPTATISGVSTLPIAEGTGVTLMAHPADAGVDDTFTYAWSVKRDNIAFVLPEGTVTTAAILTFTATDNGSYIATCVVRDNDLASIDAVSDAIVVTNVAPTGTISGAPLTSIAEGTTVDLTAHPSDVGAEDTAFTYSWSVKKDTLTYVLPQGTVTNTAAFSFVPNDNGSYVATVRVTDKDTAHVDVSTSAIIATNLAPTGTISGVPETSITEGTPVNLTANPSDAGGADTAFTYSWSVKKDTLTYVLPQGTVTNAAAFSFIPNDNGSYVATVRITDKDTGFVDVSTIAIIATNVAPTVTINGAPVISINEGTVVALTTTVTDTGTADTFTYLWSVTRNNVAYTLNGAQTDGANFSFIPRDNGTFVVTLVMQDDENAQATKSVTFTAKNVNPIASISGEPEGAIVEGTPVTLTAVATDAGADDTITYSWSVKLNNVAYTLPSETVTNLSTFTFTPRDNGTVVATVIVTDDDNGAGSVLSTPITVTNANPTATITGAPLSPINEGDLVTLHATAADVGADDTFTYAWSVKRNDLDFVLPEDAIINAAAFSFNPNDEGTYVATCVIHDDNDGIVTVSTANITANNVAPTGSITGVPEGVKEGALITLGLNVSDVGAADTIASYVWSVKKGEVNFTLPQDAITNAATFSFTPTDEGSYVVSCIVTDNDEAGTTITANAIIATNANPTGTMSGVPSGSTVEGTAIALSVVATDAGALDTLTYSWSVKKDEADFTLPQGAIVNASSFTFTPTDNGSYIATCIVTDNDSGSADVSSGAMTVVNANPSGTITGQPEGDTPEGTAINLSVEGTDAGALDVAGLIYSWSVKKGEETFTLPEGTDTSSADFSFAPTDNGSYVATVTVTDKDGGHSDVSTNTITVNNVAPTATVSFDGDLEANHYEGAPLTFTAHPVDPGINDTFTYSWQIAQQVGSNWTILLLPSDLVVTDASFTYITSDNGVYKAICTIRDNSNDGVNASSSVITVLNASPTGTLTGEPEGNVNEGTPIHLVLNPSDPGGGDVDGLTFSWSVTRDEQEFVVPEGVDHAGTEFNFIPTDDGSYVATVRITDHDGAHIDVSTDPMTVVNVDPTGTITGQPEGPVNEGAQISLTANPSDVGVLDTFTYSWSVTQGEANVTLPEETDTTSATFNFILPDNGSYVATVTITDNNGGHVDVSSDPIVANNVNPTATITGAPTVNSGSAATLPDAGADTVNDSLYLFGIHEQVLVGEAGPGQLWTSIMKWQLPQGLTVDDVDGATLVLHAGSSTARQVNLYTFDTVSDIVAGGEYSAANAATTIVQANILGNAFQTVTISNSALTDAIKAALTAGRDHVTFAIRLADNTVQDSLDVGWFYGTTSENTANRPTLTIGAPSDGTVEEGSTTTLTAGVTDPGSIDTFTYQWTVTKGTESYDLGEQPTGNPTFDFIPNDNGDYSISVLVSDNNGGEDTDTVGITVTNVNPAATIIGEPQGSITEGAPVTLSVTPTDAGSADTFTYVWSVKKGDEDFVLPQSVDTSASAFTFTPTDNGSYVVSVMVGDLDGGSVVATSNAITVTNVNPTVGITGMPEGSSDEGAPITLVAHPADAGTDDNFTYAWSVKRGGEAYTLPEDVNVSSATFTFVPDDEGSYLATVTVTDDDEGSVSVSTDEMTVANVDPTLTITGAPEGSVVEGAAISLAGSIADVGVNDTFTYVWSVTRDDQIFALPEETVVNVASFSFIPTDNGAYVVTLTCTDHDGGTATETANIAVTNANPTATITGEPESSIAEGTAVTLTATPADVGIADTFTYAWNVTRGDNAYTLPQDAVTNAATFTFTPRDNGSFIATCVISDDDSGSVSVSSQSITATNVTPTGTLAGAPESSILEGTPVSMTFSVSDAGADDSFTYAWSVTRNESAFALPNGANTTASAFSFTPTNQGEYLVTCVVTDDDGDSVTRSSGAIIVTNAAPTATVSTPSVGVRGRTTPVTAIISDSGATDGQTITWNWGDGSPTEHLTANGSTTLGRFHVFAAPASYIVTVTSADDSGASVTATTVVTIKAAAMLQDPLDPTKSALVVGGTGADDSINFIMNSNGRVKLTINGVVLGSFAPTGHIIAYGDAGTNSLTVDKSITMPTVLYGGSGRDMLSGGAGDDIIVGRKGNDALFGNGGRDILIGGVGGDALDGGEGEDILIGGTTVQMEEKFAELGAISAEWSRLDANFSNRMKHLKGNVLGGLNGAQRLTSGWVFDDSTVDALAGKAGRDWFFQGLAIGAADTVTDLVAGEDTVSGIAPTV